MARHLHNQLVNRITDAALREVAPLVSGRLLDIGCADKPYRAIFAPYVSEHVGCDHADTPHSLASTDIVATAYDIPVPDSSFDSILCTAVLEHLEDPSSALTEARRVLCDRGIAVYVAPFFWHLHEEPRDFYRYSKYGLRYLFEQSGFEILQLRALGGFWVTVGQLSAYYVYRFAKGPLRFLIDGLAVCIQLVAGLLDRLDRAEEWTWAYIVVARAR